MTDDDLALSDFVLFLFSTRSEVDRFSAALRPRWRGWSAQDGDVWMVSAELGSGEDDLAHLLRQAQSANAELARATFDFCLDDRVYCLDVHARRDAVTSRA
jgi:hypothetical protein